MLHFIGSADSSLTRWIGRPDQCAFIVKHSRAHVVRMRPVLALGGNRKDQKLLQGYVQPIAPPNPLAQSPWYFKIPMVLIAVSLTLRLVKRLTRPG